ncbi:XRE family transcriptional regulator [Kitasatospora sp. NPDC056651]|uniref:XRE family transcriptional regulator n=1 Tax=Kitasatospora sp. NPDC056651 TaxID=3345892 RepID=UPI0036A5627F
MSYGEFVGGNPELRAVMRDLGLTRVDLVLLINRELVALGCPGTLTVSTWLSGQSRWPQGRIRMALERALNRTPEQLGFIPPSAVKPRVPPEEPVLRRKFLAVSVTAALPPAVSRGHAVGHSDVDRLQASLKSLIELDYYRGGHGSLEATARTGANQALSRVECAVSEGVQRRLYSLAADYMATAGFSCIDDRRLEHAEHHLEAALRLAGLGNDQVTSLRVFNCLSMVGFQRRTPAAALSAARAAQDTQATRRDPFLASLAHARTAIAHSLAGDRQAALRSLGHATDSLGRADDRARPAWTSFYGGAELAALSAVVHQQLNDSAASESASHRALAGIPQQLRRNRASATARLALAQLGQDDIEQAADTAVSVYVLMGTDPLPPRLRTLMGDFHRGLITLAPASPVTREWTDRVHAQGVLL